MTDRIDLDDLDDGDDEDGERSAGDSLWRDGEADAAGERATGRDSSPDEPIDAEPMDGEPTDEPGDDAGEESSAGRDRMPHVPQRSGGSPAGVPASQGGSGPGAGGSAGSGGGTDSGDGPERHAEPGGDDATAGEAESPHGGGVDDMTMALTYRAAERLANPAATVADAKAWTDWLGIVGDVPAHVVNSFQREHGIDVDFFSGTEPPGERLARIGPHSMFYAERMVVVGVEGADEPVAEAADWEFVPLAEAAESADWRIASDGGKDDSESGSESGS